MEVALRRLVLVNDAKEIVTGMQNIVSFYSYFSLLYGER